MTMGPADIERKLRQHDNEIIAIYTKLDEIKATVKQHDRRFDQVDRRFDQMDRRFDQVGTKFEQVDTRFDQIGVRFDQLAEQVGTILDVLGDGGTTPR